MIQYGRHNISFADVQAVTEVLGGDWLTNGPLVAAFENELGTLIGSAGVVAVSSGTAALHTAYAAARLGPGDEVITPPITFAATQAALVHLGATPVFVDVDSDTACIDVAAVEAAITVRTRAIVAVDYAGHPADIPALRKVAFKHDLLLIEDAAHSLGALVGDQPVGSLADLTTFSFFPTKNITTGEGGAIAGQDLSLVQAARLFSHQGMVRDVERFVLEAEGPWHQEIQKVGLNYRLSDIHAALGLSQLQRLQQFRIERAKIKADYDEQLAGITGVDTPIERSGFTAFWHLYPVRVPARLRREVFFALQNAGFQVQVNYMPAYWHPALSGYAVRGQCPRAETFYSREISLPMFVGMPEDTVERVSNVIRSICSRSLTADSECPR